MPAFGTMTEHKSCGGNGATDQAVINSFTRGLNTPAEKGIGRTADQDARRFLTRNDRVGRRSARLPVSPLSLPSHHACSLSLVRRDTSA